jgi:hypothetical protein
VPARFDLSQCIPGPEDLRVPQRVAIRMIQLVKTRVAPVR